MLPVSLPHHAHPRSRIRLRATVTAIATVVLLGGSAALPADAAGRPRPPAPLLKAMQRDFGLTAAQARTRLAQEAAAGNAAAALRTRLGERVTGLWFDAAQGRLNASVTTAADARQVRAAGAVAHLVPYGKSQLTDVERVVRRQADGVPGVAGWGVDERTGRVEVRVLRTEHRAATETFRSRMRQLGRAVRLVEVTDAPVRQQGDVVGGDKWTPGSESGCSIGFSVTAGGGAKGFLTAGHCTNDADQPAYGKDSSRLGTSNAGGTHSVNAREGDFGLVDVDQPGWNLAPRVDGYGNGDVTVTGSAEGVVGQSVCRSGQTSGWRCGEITKVDQSVDYGNVVIDGLSYTDACSAGGDSGGSYVTASGGKAVGLHSGGGSNTCGSSGETFTIFQPVGEALQKWQLALATEGAQPGGVAVAAVADQQSAVGQSVEVKNSARGGTAPYTWSATGLPAGVSVDRSTGTLSGATTTAQTAKVTVTATDSAGKSASVSFTWTVGGGTGGAPSLRDPGSQTVYIGRPVRLALEATGGTGGRAFTATGLPAGLTVDRSTGTVSGTPTQWGTRTSRITVTDSAGRTASVDVTWYVFN
ncbi:putative Ig domain-containing protein [Streptomyces sp. NPDC059009]|uniref:putative Ig domain-containing protein n=1 Tax=Streptomyces sp. NPDC059009 TaxID=3346694 RepID=UPI00367C6486